MTAHLSCKRQLAAPARADLHYSLTVLHYLFASSASYLFASSADQLVVLLQDGMWLWELHAPWELELVGNINASNINADTPCLSDHTQVVLLQDGMCLWEPGVDRVLDLATSAASVKLDNNSPRPGKGGLPTGVLESVCMWGLHTPTLRSIAPVRCKLLVPSYNPLEVRVCPPFLQPSMLRSLFTPCWPSYGQTTKMCLTINC